MSVITRLNGRNLIIVSRKNPGISFRLNSYLMAMARKLAISTLAISYIIKQALL